MNKNYLLITNDMTKFYTKDDFLYELNHIEKHNKDEEIIKKDRQIKVIFAGKINIEHVYVDNREADGKPYRRF